MTKQRVGSGRGVQGRPGRRYELTDEAWQRLEPLMPTQQRGGRQGLQLPPHPPMAGTPSDRGGDSESA